MNAWREEWTAELAKLHAIVPRMTAQEIANELNRQFPDYHFGVEAVKKHRQWLIGPRPVPVPKDRALVERRAAPDRWKASRVAAQGDRRTVDLFAPDLSGLPGRRLTDLKPGQCRYEISGSDDRLRFRFCGCRVVPLPPYSYCAHHARIAYRMPEQGR